MDDEESAPAEPSVRPVAPYTPEDGAYAAIVSEFLGLQRAGSGVFGAALITAAHLTFMGMAGETAPQQDAGA